MVIITIFLVNPGYLPDFISRKHFEHIYDFMIRLFPYNTILVSNLKMFAYFPVLIFSGVASGAAIGIISWLILQRLPRG